MKLISTVASCVACVSAFGGEPVTRVALSDEPVITSFYDAIRDGDAALAASFFTEDGVYKHTDQDVANREDLESLLTKVASYVDGELNPQMVDIQTAGNAEATSALREGMRDQFFVVDNKIRAMMTTRNHPDDKPAPESVAPVVRGDEAPSNMEDEIEAVKSAVDVYFDGFVASDAAGMQSAFSEDPVVYMFDFNPDRNVPFACYMSPDCSSAPYFTSGAELLSAFQGFTQGYINLNHEFDIVEVYGDLALATTSSFGCEGDNVTPSGSDPMPNHEIFTLVKEDAGWKIKSYSFTYASQSPISPPVEIC